MTASRQPPAGIDHLVLGAPDLESGVSFVEGLVGVRPAPGGRHPRWGTHNALLALGPRSYLEVISPDPARDRPEPPTIFGLDGRDTPRLVAWCIRDPDLEGRLARAAAGGLLLGQILEGGRTTAEGEALTWRLSDPEVGASDGIVPFLIDWGGTSHPARVAPRGGELVSLRAEHPDPDRIRGMLDALEVGLPLARAPEPALVAVIRTSLGEVRLR
jgi:hypothetical protein